MEIGDTTMFQSSLPRRQVAIAMGGTMLSLFLGSLYMTIVSTAMPRIITDLGGFSQYTLVFTSYYIAEIILMPLAGRLSDIYGRKWVYVAGLSIFVVGSFLSGISQTMTQLIFFRGLQGLGFGIMMALAFIVIGDLFPPAERGKYQGLMAGTMGVSTIIGPIIGGYLTDYFSWRWCFFVNIPIGLIIILLFVLFYPRLRSDYAKHKVDYAGVVIMAFAVLSLMLALTWGGVVYDWLSTAILGMLGFSVVMFALFFLNESRAREPVVDLGLFKNQVFAVSATATFLMGFAFFAAVTFIPLYFQGVLGTSATLSGGFLTPMMLSSVVASIICGQVISRCGGYYRLMGTIGFLLMAVGLFLLSRMMVETSYTTAVMNVVLTGFGVGVIMPLHTIAVQNSVPYPVMGAATAMISLLRMVGALFGLSIVGSIMNNRFHSEFTANLPPAIRAVISPEELASIVDNPQALVNVQAQASLRSLFESLGAQGTALFEQLLLTLQDALSSALTEVFAFVFGVAVLALIINLFLKGIPSHRLPRGKEKGSPQ